MGLSASSSKGIVYDVNKIYWDNDGNLRYGKSNRNRDDELIKILQDDRGEDSDQTQLWIIVPSRWLRKWLIFAKLKAGEEPGKIDTKMLLTQDSNAYNGWRPLQTLKPPSIASKTTATDPKAPNAENAVDFPGHYRRVTLSVWKNLVDLYGVNGPVIAVRGFPYDDLSRWRVFLQTDDVNINLLPEPVIPEKEAEKKKTEKKTGGILGIFQ